MEVADQLLIMHGRIEQAGNRRVYERRD